MGELDGKHAIVTGGARGIGAAVARALATHGAAVTITGRDEARLEVCRERLATEFDGRCRSVVMDVTKPESVTAAIAGCSAKTGRPTILVNNAGIAETAAFVDTTIDVWNRALAVNLTGAYLVSREVLPGMALAGGGCIVNIASTAGLRGYAFVSAYTAAKHGLVGLTKAMALETAKHRVTVNAVCPGFTDTEMLEAAAAGAAAATGKTVQEIKAQYAATNASGRLVEPKEVAGKVAWLCLPGQAKVTGEIVVIE